MKSLTLLTLILIIAVVATLFSYQKTTTVHAQTLVSWNLASNKVTSSQVARICIRSMDQFVRPCMKVGSVDGYGRFFLYCNESLNTPSLYRCDDNDCKIGCNYVTSFTGTPETSYIDAWEPYNFTGTYYSNLPHFIFTRWWIGLNYGSDNPKQGQCGKLEPNLINAVPTGGNVCIEGVEKSSKFRCDSGTPSWTIYHESGNCGSGQTEIVSVANNTCFDSRTQHYTCHSGSEGSGYYVVIFDRSSVGSLLFSVPMITTMFLIFLVFFSF